jgi:GNAT superfamily N-acetyltransferase
MSFVIQALSEDHDRERFDCGEPALNEFLRRYARQNQERGVSRIFVAVPAGSPVVVGYYSLAAGSVAFESVPDALRRRLPRYPLPVAHLGRLATCQTVRGQDLGEALLFDALARTLRVAAEIGVVAVDVWAKSDRAREYYRRYGFHPLTDDGLHLFLPLETVRKLIGR